MLKTKLIIGTIFTAFTAAGLSITCLPFSTETLNSTTQSVVQYINNSNTAMQNAVTKLTQDNSTISNQQNQINQDNSTMSTQQSQINQDNTTMSNQQNQINQDNTTISNQQGQINSSSSIIASLKQQLQAANNTIANQQSTITAQQNTINNDQYDLSNGIYQGVSPAITQAYENALANANSIPANELSSLTFDYESIVANEINEKYDPNNAAVDQGNIEAFTADFNSELQDIQASQ